MADLASVTEKLVKQNQEELAKSVKDASASLQSAGARQALNEIGSIFEQQSDVSVKQFTETRKRIDALSATLENMEGVSNRERQILEQVLQNSQASIKENAGFKAGVKDLVSDTVKGSLDGIGGLVTGALSQSPLLAMGASFIGQRVKQFRERRKAAKEENAQREERIAAQRALEKKEFEVLRTQISNEDAIARSNMDQEKIQEEARRRGVSEDEVINEIKDNIIRKAQADKQDREIKKAELDEIEALKSKFGLDGEPSVSQPENKPEPVDNSGIEDKLTGNKDALDEIDTKLGPNEPYLAEIRDLLQWMKDNDGNPTSLEIEEQRELRRERKKDQQIELAQLKALQALAKTNKEISESGGPGPGGDGDGSGVDLFGAVAGGSFLGNLFGGKGKGKGKGLLGGLKNLTKALTRGKLGKGLLALTAAIGGGSLLTSMFRAPDLPEPNVDNVDNTKKTDADNTKKTDADNTKKTDADAEAEKRAKAKQQAEIEKMKQRQRADLEFRRLEREALAKKAQDAEIKKFDQRKTQTDLINDERVRLRQNNDIKVAVSDGVNTKVDPAISKPSAAPRAGDGGLEEARKIIASNNRGVVSAIDSAASAAGNQTGSVAKVASSIDKKLAMKILAKNAAGVAVKAIPALGIAAGGIFALGRLFEGDFAGAAAEGAGIFLPSLAGAPLDIGLMVRDTYNDMYRTPENPRPFDTDSTTNPELFKQRTDELTQLAKEMISGAENNIEKQNQILQAKEKAKIEENIKRLESTLAKEQAALDNTKSPKRGPDPVKEARQIRVNKTTELLNAEREKLSAIQDITPTNTLNASGLTTDVSNTSANELNSAQQKLAASEFMNTNALDSAGPAGGAANVVVAPQSTTNNVVNNNTTTAVQKPEVRHTDQAIRDATRGLHGAF